MVGNQTDVGLPKFRGQVLNRNRRLETDRGLDAEVLAERLDLVQVIARADYPEPDERKPLVQQSQRRQRGIEPQAAGDRAMADDRKRLVARFASRSTPLTVKLRDRED